MKRVFYFTVLFFCFFISKNNLCSQVNTWVLHTSSNPLMASGNTVLWNTHRFPKEKVLTYAKEKSMYIADVTYSSEKGWTSILSKKYTKQDFSVTTAYPAAFIKEKQQAGLKLTSLAYDNNKWVAVMSDDKSLGTQNVFVYNSVEALLAAAAKKDTIQLTQICAAKDKVYGVYSVIKGAGEQRYQSAATFPLAWVNQQLKEGYSTTDLFYYKGKWHVVMTQMPKTQQFQEKYYIKQNLTPEDITALIKDSKGQIAKIDFSFDLGALEGELDKYIALGDSLYMKRKYEDAIEYYNIAAGIYPLYDDLLFSILDAKYMVGQYDGLIKQADFILKFVEETSAKALYYKGLAYYYIDKPYEALTFFYQAIKYVGNDKELLAAIHYEIAVAYEYLGMFKKAITKYDYIIKTFPANTALLNNTRKNKTQAEQALKSNKEAEVTITSTLTSQISVNKAVYNLKAFVLAVNLQVGFLELLLNEKKIPYNFNAAVKGKTGDYDIAIGVTLKTGRNTLEIVVKNQGKKEIGSNGLEIFYRPDEKESVYHALLIGVNDYKNFPKLDQPLKDVEVMHRVLSEKYTFNPDNIHVLASPYKTDVITTLRNLQQIVKPNDNILIFYAGHGFVDTVGKGLKSATQRGYWIPSDGGKVASKEEWINTVEIADMVNGFNAKNILVVADACFSGSLLDNKFKFSPTEKISTPATCVIDSKKTSLKIFTSGGLTEVDDKSVFIRSFLTLLNNNTKPCISAAELYPQVYKEAKAKKASGEPQFGVFNNSRDAGSDFLFIKK